MKREKIKWSFLVVLWDDEGNTLLYENIIIVERVCRFTAKKYLEKKFPLPYFVELKA